MPTDKLAESMPSSSTTSNEEIARWIQQAPSIYGNKAVTETIKSLSFNTTDYEKKKLNAVNEFYDCLRHHPHLSSLATLVEDPELGGLQTNLIVRIRGMKTPAKKAIVNCCFLAFGRFYRKREYRKTDLDAADAQTQADAQYQPNVVAVTHRMIFSYFTEQSVIYGIADFKSAPGQFMAFWKYKFAEAAELRSDFGKRPNRAAREVDEEFKIRNQADPPYFPFSNVDDLLALVMHSVQSHWLYRGSEEPHGLLAGHVTRGTYKDGEFKGLRWVCIGATNAEKGQTLTLSKSSLPEDEDSFRVRVENPVKDPFDPVPLIWHYIDTHLPPDHKGKFFLHAAAQKVMRVRFDWLVGWLSFVLCCFL